jgi:hypothetical protein
MAALALLVRYRGLPLHTLLAAAVVPVTLAHLQEEILVYTVCLVLEALLERVVLVEHVISDVMRLEPMG